MDCGLVLSTKQSFRSKYDLFKLSGVCLHLFEKLPMRVLFLGEWDPVRPHEARLLPLLLRVRLCDLDLFDQNGEVVFELFELSGRDLCSLDLLTNILDFVTNILIAAPLRHFDLYSQSNPLVVIYSTVLYTRYGC